MIDKQVVTRSMRMDRDQEGVRHDEREQRVECADQQLDLGHGTRPGERHVYQAEPKTTVPPSEPKAGHEPLLTYEGRRGEPLSRARGAPNPRWSMRTITTQVSWNRSHTVTCASKQVKPDLVVVFMEANDVDACQLLSMLRVDSDLSGVRIITSQERHDGEGDCDVVTSRHSFASDGMPIKIEIVDLTRLASLNPPLSVSSRSGLMRPHLG